MTTAFRSLPGERVPAELASWIHRMDAVRQDPRTGRDAEEHSRLRDVRSDGCHPPDVGDLRRTCEHVGLASPAEETGTMLSSMEPRRGERVLCLGLDTSTYALEWGQRCGARVDLVACGARPQTGPGSRRGDNVSFHVSEVPFRFLAESFDKALIGEVPAGNDRGLELVRELNRVLVGHGIVWQFLASSAAETVDRRSMQQLLRAFELAGFEAMAQRWSEAECPAGDRWLVTARKVRRHSYHLRKDGPA